MPDPDSLKAVAKKGKTRRWSRRWAKMCDDCGSILVFLENSQPPIPGKRWSPWALVEIFGVRDGEPCFWDGSISYDPRVHVLHNNCVRNRRRIAWTIRNKVDYDL